MDTLSSTPLPGERAGAWAKAHLPVLLFALLMLLVVPARDLWSPDEPDFAQCVKEMNLRGTWLFPWLNGEIYTEKPILYYWVMKASNGAMGFLTGQLGFTKGLAAWALRLPSALASLWFLLRFQDWAGRFLQKDVARLAVMILATTPLWFWQSQYIQIDMLFPALLAWAWCRWLGGYLLLRGAVEGAPGESSRHFLWAYGHLALAFLAKGPLALVLSGLVVGAFLLWQRDFRILREMRLGWGLLILAALVAPWYVAAGLEGGPGYVYAMVIRQNFDRATRAWDHLQPVYQYLVYMAGDFFPWVLLLPPLGFYLKGSGALKSPTARFLLLAFAVPFLFLSAVQSKQGKYLLMSYPFLALLLAGMLQPLAVEGVSLQRIRRIGLTLAAGLALPGLVALLAAAGVGGAKLQAQVAPFRALAWTLGGVGTFGAVALVGRSVEGQGRFLVPETALTLGLLFLAGGAWGFRALDAQKGPKAWTAAAAPHLQGRRVWFWGEIRSAAMVYTGHLMPELRAAKDLAKVDPADRIVVIRSRWKAGYQGLSPEEMARFEPVMEKPLGGDDWCLMRLKEQPQ